MAKRSLKAELQARATELGLDTSGTNAALETRIAEAGGRPPIIQGLPLRRGEPGVVYGYTLGDGTARELTADDAGIVTPELASDVQLFDSFGLETVGGAKRAPDATPAVVPAVPVAVGTPADETASADKEG